MCGKNVRVCDKNVCVLRSWHSLNLYNWHPGSNLLAMYNYNIAAHIGGRA